MRPKGIRRIAGPLAAGALVLVASLTAGAGQASAGTGGGDNDASCKPSAAHPYPVVLLHGLGATYYEDLNFLQADLAFKGYCTFSATYGAYPGFPLVGGLKQISDSAPEIAALGIQPETQTVLDTLGCGACSDLVSGGAAVTTLDAGPITRPGVQYTVITSRADELVTPTGTTFVAEPGVRNEYVQDTCPLDPVGHIVEAYDANVWHLIENALDPRHAAGFLCVLGSPG